MIAERMNVTCPACDSPNTDALGVLPVFTPDESGLLNGSGQSRLYRCRRCELRFRHPVPTAEELKNYYGTLASEEWWQYEEEREVWRHVRTEIEHAPARTVLDVGCFRGDLLAFLGDAWQRFGVEPSLDARRVAESRGVKVIGETIDSLADSTMRFGAITLIDVIEHLPRPLDSLRKLIRLLPPNGRLVIFTGATDAPSWRFSGEHYWYSAMPEHVVFFRPSWFRWAAPQLGCAVESVRRLSFHPAPPRERADEALKNVAYVGFKRLAQLPLVGVALTRLPIVRRIGGWTGSWWTTARDHALVTLVRQGDDSPFDDAPSP